MLLGSGIDMSEENPWKTLDSRIIYTNAWIRLREDQVIRPDGAPGIYSVVETKIATAVVALDNNLEVFLVGQYRYPTQCYSWEIIAGGTDAGESSLEAAQRELKEEAGLQARQWEQLGSDIQLSNCFSNEIARIYLARDLQDVGAEPEATEVLTMKKLPLAEALQQVADGTINDSLSVLGLLLLERKLRAQGALP